MYWSVTDNIEEKVHEWKIFSLNCFIISSYFFRIYLDSDFDLWPSHRDKILHAHTTENSQSGPLTITTGM